MKLFHAQNKNTSSDLMIWFSGESNSGGLASNDDLSAGELAPRSSVKIYNNSTLTFQDLDIGTNNTLGHIDAEGPYHGWEAGLANEVELGNLPNPVWLVKTGQGGTKIADWAVGGTYGGISPWQKMQDRIDDALIEKPGTLKILWYSQGINDIIAGTNVSTWESATIAHFAKIRAKYGDIPILMTTFMNSRTSYNSTIINLPNLVSNLYIIRAGEVTTTDSNHWNSAQMKVIATAMVNKTKEIYGL